MKFFMERKGISICCKGEKESEICGFILFQQKSQNSLRIHSQLSIHSLSQVGNHMGTTAPAQGAEATVHKTDTPLAGGWTLVLGLLSLLPLATQWHYRHLRCTGQNLQRGVSLSVSVLFNSVSVVANTLWPNGLQHARLPCLSPTPGDYVNSWPSSQRCHPTISSSVIPFPSHLRSFSAAGSFQISQFFASRGQSIEVSASSFQWILRADFL